MRRYIERYFWIVAGLFYVIVLIILMGSYRSQLSGFDSSVSNAENLASGGTEVQRVIMAISFALGFLPVIFRISRSAKIFSYSYPVYILPILAVLSTAWSVDPGLTLFKSVVFLSIYIYCLGVVNLFSAREAVGMYVTAGCLITFLSLATVVLMPSIGMHQASDGFQSTHAGQWRGIFNHRTQLGQFSAIFCVFLFAYRKHLPIWLVVPTFMGGVLCIVFADSQGGYISLAVGLVLFSLVRAVISRGLGAQIALVVAGLIVAASGQYLINTLGPVVLEMLGKNPTLTGRTDIWNLVLVSATGHVALGRGFSAGIAQVLGSSEQLQILPNAQSGYLDLYIAFGVVGVTLIVLSWIWIAGKALAMMNTLGRLNVPGSAPIADGLSYCIAMVVVMAQMSIGESYIAEGNNYLQPTLGLVITAFFTMAREAINQASVNE